VTLYSQRPTAVVEAAKKTGDYSVLSHADLCVLALTLELAESEKLGDEKNDGPTPEAVSSHLMSVSTHPYIRSFRSRHHP
jgi:rRNA maturation endonuclease Nob1